jgi:hypothetical protein
MDSFDLPPVALAIIAALAVIGTAWATYSVITERHELDPSALALMAGLVIFAIVWAIGLAVHERSADMPDKSRD